MFNELLEIFIESKLISSSQSGFKPGGSCINQPYGSCINQLLYITHELYSFFNEDVEARSVFLNISKAFDKVWHDGIIFKLIQIGISGNLLKV